MCTNDNVTVSVNIVMVPTTNVANTIQSGIIIHFADRNVKQTFGKRGWGKIDTTAINK